MKAALFVAAVLAIAISAQGKEGCNGKLDPSFCPNNTAGITITSKSSKTDKGILEESIKCEDSSGTTIAECHQNATNPDPRVTISSFQFIGNYRTSSRRHDHRVVTNAKDNDVETFQ